ncbi:MAG: hypothetical protein EA402_13320 [Planctomycetota bacterium]|nr:MAG: hypothetical protein EA402_13320 [Planctomycetota bacterium]
MSTILDSLEQAWQQVDRAESPSRSLLLAARLAVLQRPQAFTQVQLAAAERSALARQEAGRAVQIMLADEAGSAAALETVQDLLCLQSLCTLDAQAQAAIADAEELSDSLVVDEDAAQHLSELAWPGLLPADLQLPALAEPLTPLDLAAASTMMRPHSQQYPSSERTPMSPTPGSSKPIIKMRWQGSGPQRLQQAAATPLTREKIQDFQIAAYTVRVFDENHGIDFNMMVGRDVVWREENGVKKQFFQFLIDPGQRAVSNVVLVDPWWCENETKPGWLLDENDEPVDHAQITPGKSGGLGEAYPERTLGWLFTKRRGHPLRKTENGLVWELEITDKRLHDRELWYLDEGHYCTEFDDCKLVIDWFNVLDEGTAED